MPKHEQLSDPLIADLAERAAEVSNLKDRAEFSASILKRKLHKIITEFTDLFIEARVIKGKGKNRDSEALTGKLMELQGEIEPLNDQQQLKEAQFKDLETRLQSIEALLIGDRAERN